MPDAPMIDGTSRNMPPAWRRSLTESAMRQVPTRLDRVVVAVFALTLLGMLGWLVVTLAPPA
ncbi:MAG: hypothetical protein QOI98_1902 [Solirubrobacteraceae bacterium]|nr:hypothetical protein [Solirubrobacteraceae bacterium]